VGVGRYLLARFDGYSLGDVIVAAAAAMVVTTTGEKTPSQSDA
jgi:hypothetical protein